MILSEDHSESLELSKKAQKRMLKMARLEERKIERRAKEKATRKEKKIKRAEKIAAGEQVSENEGAQKRAKLNRVKEPFAARVVLDLGFDDKMSDKEIISLCSQLAYVYSINRRSPNPFRSLLFTSLNGRTLSRLEKLNQAGYKRWVGTEWWSEGYDRLWVQTLEEFTPRDGEGFGDATSKEDWAKDNIVEKSPEESLAVPVSQNRVVYLTADSSEILEELREGETYIIGGICDHNRYKNLCLDKARASGVRAAQLPIGRYLSHLSTRKVLTVNQVFGILVKWVETRDWELSFYSVIPKRKFQDRGRGREPTDMDFPAKTTVMEEEEPAL
ncbi:guanine-1-methyltransferase-domain-containing protein [Multifurca ochricompacta]|uniref:tRNA (guanine(9)-N1)-methyltransferase n=1 Tax=Multifurca ochricompacta TaxID=376703 RepID=A0AAD4MBP1_9AGAM|nr:guanine-1-methyltransferase-domain-containing protein [Multifurca ochricompacta]